ncbi:hypothetical protein G7Y79_00007g022080 [Physcia stellaris]|nr:hypothetical protein G7Y79_00007g022080 [Physcia stellaris]
MSHSDFGILPREIYVEIAKYSGKSTRVHLCLVSKPFNGLLNYLVYEDVDISLHDTSEITSTSLKHIHLNSARIPDPDDYPSASWRLPDLQFVMQKRRQQDRCLQMMAARPAYATFVKNLKWTIFTPGALIELIDRPERDEVCRLWHVLSLMTNVSRVDIAYGSMADVTNLSNILSANQPLFLSATSIRLAGVMNGGLVNAILHDCILKHIQHLEIDNLTVIKLDNSVQKATSSAPNPVHMVTHQDPRLFARISGHCSSLKSFKWHKLWEYLVPHDSEKSEYHAGIAFIDSVRPHLEHLFFDPSAYSSRLCFVDHQFFVEYLQPILLERSWPCLKSLYLTATQPAHLQLSHLAAEQAAGRKEMLLQLRSALGPDVKLVVPLGASDPVWDTRFADIYSKEERCIRSQPNSTGSSLNI